MDSSITITRAKLASALGAVEMAMNEADALAQLAFWIEGARESLERMESFLLTRPQVKQEAAAFGLTLPTWDLDQSEGLRWLQSRLGELHHQALEAARTLSAEASEAHG